ncbi:uncharacterized protein K02A2.6-like [Galendromus occidentalis]|uniref:RNA-directed DNA polymerase n=1 Tax=Galendromus occidentalis TaxID=34638 RepID=A0AAJ6QPJ0_9ACAR|nr:uncharacterized protein K02A2.6-like [Galendromus occidentalis]
MGSAAYAKLYDKIHPEKKPCDLTFDEIIKQVNQIYEPEENLFGSRIAFRKLVQAQGESLAEFEARLRKSCTDCAWRDAELQFNLMEQFIAGLINKQMKQAVLMKSDKFTKFSELFDFAMSVEMARKTVSVSEPVSSSGYSVNFVKDRSAKSHKRPFLKPKANFRGKQPACYRCGDKSHLAPACRHKSTTCATCGKSGHIQQVCRSGQKHNFIQLEELPFHFVESDDPIRVTVLINNHPVRMEIDSGSGISTMPLQEFQRILPGYQRFETDICLRTATGESFTPHSYAMVEVKLNNISSCLRLYLFDQPKFPTLFGRQWLRKFPLDFNKLMAKDVLQLQASSSSVTDCYKTRAKELLKKYKNLLKDGIGCIPNSEAKLELTTEKPHPVYMRARPVAHSLIKMTDGELDYLEKNDVIQKIDCSDWSHPIVIVPRAQGKKVRICGDFKVGINKYIRVDDHPLKNIRHALDNIGNGLRFTKLDISSAFLHLPVRVSDRKYLVVNTHRGLYQFNRMSNGLSNASAIWQRFIEGILAGIDGVECVIDDIIITAASDAEHLRRLEEVFARLDRHDIRLNADKCVFFEDTVTYCGFRLKHQEIFKCEDKVEAIRKAPTPTNVSEVRSFIGMIQFYAAFAPKLADLAHPLYALLKNDVKFVWDETADRAFQQIKSELCSPNVLTPFDPDKPLLLATDASPYGISAVLSHKFPDNSERPIAYYSRSLTPTERKYSQIDKEALGIRCGVEKFFYYIFGRRFKLITDSKPLVQIFSPHKALPPLSASRMQHYSIYLMNFNFDIVYRSTHDHGNADALSRLPLKSEQLQEMNAIDVFLVRQLQDLPLNLVDIVRETKKSLELKPLLDFLHGSGRRNEMTKFFGIDLIEFSLLDQSVILRGHRIVIPESCRKRVLCELHEGHYGILKMKCLARQHVWWPSLDKDIEELASGCIACLTHARNPPKMIHNWEQTSYCFQRIHLDYAGPIGNKYILLLVDAHSKWLEAFVTNDKTSATTLKHLRETIARFGIPSIMVTDNDPTFVSHQMKTFCAANGITHKTSPAFHPASNGQVERYVATTKTALKKLSSEGGDLQENLTRFLYRQHMVISSTGGSPSSLMLGRELRSRLDLLREKPHAVSAEVYDDKNAKFKPAELVMVKDFRGRKPTWIPGKVERLLGKTMCSIRSVPANYDM